MATHAAGGRSVISLIFAALVQAQAVTVPVGPGHLYTSITDGLAAATVDDTVLVAPGVYHEHIQITKPIVLRGRPGAIIEGDGRGTVITVMAPSVISGFTIRGSGSEQYREHSGVLAQAAHGLVVEDNEIEDVLFGIYVKQSDSVIIRRNVIVGKRLATPLRGDGIRLWYSNGALVTDNEVERTRDLVVWFSNDATIRQNVVRDGRYGLHYMYSHRNVFEENRFLGNQVGAFIMYSADIVFRRNLFADARGTTGRGLGFKDADRITATENTLVKNAIGISIDNSPQSAGARNVFRNNLIAYNDMAVSMLPSVHSNVFEDNAFVDNVQTISVSGGGTALANNWRGNHWSDYAGFDANHNGYGDTPFSVERLSDDLLDQHEALRILNLSPALALVNTLSRVLPFLAPEPLVIDSIPRLQRYTLGDAAKPGTQNAPGAAAGFAVTAVLAGLCAFWLRRPLRETQ